MIKKSIIFTILLLILEYPIRIFYFDSTVKCEITSYAQQNKKNFFSTEIQSTNFSRLENDIILNFYQGNSFNVYNSIEKLLLRFPNRPESFLYFYDLIRLTEVCGYKRVEKTLNDLIKLIKQRSKFKKRNLSILTLKIELEKLFYRFNRKKAVKISRELSPLRRWVIMGPYKRYGISDIDYPFLPEISLDPNGLDVRKKRVNIKNPRGILDIQKYLYPEKGIAYALTTIRCNNKPLKIRVYSKCPYKLFINGIVTIINKSGGKSRRYRILKVWGTEKITLMIKIHKTSRWDFRILVTDEEDRIIRPITKSPKTVFNDFKFKEEMDYPFDYFIKKIKKDPGDSFFRLGSYFYELESKEAIEFYKKSIHLKRDPLNQYLLANCMLELSDGDRESELYMSGWGILNNLAKEYPQIIPFQHKKFKKLIMSRSILPSYLKGRDILKKGSQYIPFRIDFVNLLKALGYEREFEDEIESIAKEFPSSIEPLKIQAKFYRNKNLTKTISLYNKILEKEYSVNTIKELIEIYRDQEKYSKAIKLIKKFDYNDHFKNDLIEILIDSGDFGKAKNILFREMLKKNTPFYNLKLGFISFLNDIDPTMYWKKMLKLKPSYYSFDDYIKYTNKRKVGNPFKEFKKENIKDKIAIWLQEINKKNKSIILNRGMIFILNNDETSRVFCEDVIYFKDQKAIDKWGEYRAHFKGKIFPVHIRAYNSDGSFSDSYKIQKVDNISYITLQSLKKGSIVHISYYLNNPLQNPKNSTFFTIPFTEIHNFNESLLHFSLKVIAPENKKINFSFNRPIEIMSEIVEDNVIYSASLNNLKKVNREKHMGSRLNHLPFFAFSTMIEIKDFVTWYKGFLFSVFDLYDDSLINQFKGKNNEEVVRRVYDYISREIELSSNYLFLPEKATYTDFKRSGSVEDKVILAKSILNNLGINSYIAFARRDDLPEVNSFLSPDFFSNILLYIPIDIKNCIWIDFSNQYYDCGVVDERLNGTKSVVIIKNGYEIKEITDNCNNNKIFSDFFITVNMQGNIKININVKFNGRKGKIRKYFQNTNYNEDAIYSYFGNFIPSFIIEDFKIKNLKNNNKPFEISVKGNSFSIITVGVDKMIFQPIIKKSIVHKYIRYIERKYPLYINENIDECDNYTYTLPSIFNNFKIDKEQSIESKFGYAKIEFKKLKGESKFIISKKIKINKTKINTTKYKDFLNFCLRLKLAENQNIVLKK